jgi:hypothetical protein
MIFYLTPFTKKLPNYTSFLGNEMTLTYRKVFRFQFDVKEWLFVVSLYDSTI